MSTHPLGERGGKLAFFGQLLEGNFRQVRLGISMFNDHPHKPAILIEVNQDVLIDIPGLHHFLITKLDIGGVFVSEKYFTFMLVS